MIRLQSSDRLLRRLISTVTIVLFLVMIVSCSSWRTIPLAELKGRPELEELALVRRGNRLSVMPVSEEEWNFVLGLE